MTAPDPMPPLPIPEVIHELHDAPCPACRTMLRTLPPVKLGYTADQMRAYARAALAATPPSPAQAAGWRDIESAPRDGTSILGYWLGGQHDCAIHATKFHRGRWWEPNEDYPQREPTHWMPLPAAPGHPPSERQGLTDEQIDALRVDAMRYRWLRDVSVPPHNFYLSVPIEFDGVRYAPAEVDAAIDAAIGIVPATPESAG